MSKSDRTLRSEVIRLASSFPQGSPERRVLLATLSDRTAGHPAKDIGPELIQIVGKQLNIGRDWYKGSYYEAIGDEIMEYIRHGGGHRTLIPCLQPVVKSLLANNMAKLKLYGEYE